MSAVRGEALPARVAAIKLATRRAVEAAGGQQLVAAAIGRTQGRVSDYCSLHTTDCIPVDLAFDLDAMAEAATGALPIIAMLSRLAVLDAGCSDYEDGDPVHSHLPTIAAEHADLIRVMAAKSGGTLSAEDVRILMTEAADLHDAVNAFMRDLAA